MLDKTNLLSLMKTVANANRTAAVSYSVNGQEQSLSYEALNETLRNELKEYAGTYAQYRQNKNLIFEVIEETLDDVLPRKLQDAYGQFAEVKQFAQGDKPLFRRKMSGRARAKQFITRVGLAGKYEVFKLGGEEAFEVPTSALGGAAQIGFEEFLDGRADFAELVAIVLEGMDEAIVQEIARAMIGAIGQLPTANKYSVAGYDEAAFDRALTVASAYGEPTIYCSYDFAVKMIPKEQWMFSDRMKDELWQNGHFQNYKGRRVVILPNSFTDETNTVRVLDPGYVWIIPTGGDKPVKVALEGETLVDEFKNQDWSREIQVYKKVGVVALMTNDICSYIDTSLTGKLAYTDIGPLNGLDGINS